MNYVYFSVCSIVHRKYCTEIVETYDGMTEVQCDVTINEFVRGAMSGEDLD